MNTTVATSLGLPTDATEQQIALAIASLQRDAARGRAKRAQHSSETPEHGSPPEFVQLAHDTFGLPDVDPASSPQWNGLVRARRIITEQENGLRTPWFEGAPPPLELRTNPLRPVALRPYTVFVNPPGEPTGDLVAQFWFAIAEYYRLGWFRAGIWIGFNVEQLARLQRTGAATHPLAEITLVPSSRKAYRITPTKINPQPPHASFVTLLSRESATRKRFAAFAGELGYVVNGDRW